MKDQDVSILIFSDLIYEKKGTSLHTQDSHIIFMDKVGSHFQEKTYLGRISQKKIDKKTYKTAVSLDNFIEIPYYSSLKDLPFLSVSKIIELIKKIRLAIKKSDVLWLSWPHPISLLIILLQIGKGKKVILNVRCDLTKLVRIRHKGLFRFLASSFIAISNRFLALFFKNFTVMVTGTELKDKYSRFFSNTYAIKDTTISRDDILHSEREISGPVNLLSVGRLEPEKGIEYLLEAIPLVQEKYPVSLRIIGDGEKELALESLSQELEIKDSVKFHGYIPFGKDLFQHYVHSDIFVLPSLSEGLPRVVNEARTFGLPIISTHVGGLKTELKDQENCLKVKVKSPKDISEKIISLIENRKLYQNISATLYNESVANNIEHQSANVISNILSCYE